MKKTKLTETLRKSGLSEKSAAVYLALLDLGGAFPSRVASYTQIKRSTAYNTLAELAIKGLVSEIKVRGRYFFSVEHPRRLVDYSARRIKNAEEDLEMLKESLPELEGLYVGSPNKPKVSYFEGVDGVMAIYEDHISAKTAYEMLGFVNVAELLRFLPQKKYREYVQRKEQIGIKTRGIIPDTQEDRSYEKSIYSGTKKNTIPDVRFVPKESFPWKGDVTLYDKNKISMVTFDERGVSGIVVESAAVHGIIRMGFELAWKGALSESGVL